MHVPQYTCCLLTCPKYDPIFIHFSYTSCLNLSCPHARMHAVTVVKTALAALHEGQRWQGGGNTLHPDPHDRPNVAMLRCCTRCRAASRRAANSTSSLLRGLLLPPAAAVAAAPSPRLRLPASADPAAAVLPTPLAPPMLPCRLCSWYPPTCERAVWGVFLHTENAS